ncbi:MAG: tRNA 2-thiouridine(34) synthase MnmA [Candidatus Caenarcaniphilales bacterium]|nr:tRNA 2-thiouridine(34) synthase MnmA [Candidatus Caenarcaniphilales bacterium]
MLRTESQLIEEALKKVAENNVIPPKGSCIGIAMSGGVDSSVAAALLSRMDYKVFGITGWLMEGAGKCCDGGMIDAAQICETLGIDHQAEDLRKFFQSTIISPFLESYSVGRTPVPCMPCNTEVKWGSLLETSKTQGAQYLASGHYARIVKAGIVKEQNEELAVGRSVDLNKDQSYMLWGLNQEQLKRTVFPLANFNKNEIRQLAHEFGLTNWDKEESQDICFIPNKTKDYLLDNLGERPGEIKDIKTGKVIGEHMGTHLFTIGQRKGIGVSSSEPIYVIKLDSFNNIVYTGEREDLYSKGVAVEYTNWQVKQPNEFNGLVKVRYNSETVLSKVTKQSEDKCEIVFSEEVSSVTPGQAAVVYDVTNSFIIGGGWISKPI